MRSCTTLMQAFTLFYIDLVSQMVDEQAHQVRLSDSVAAWATSSSSPCKLSFTKRDIIMERKDTWHWLRIQSQLDAQRLYFSKNWGNWSATCALYDAASRTRKETSHSVPRRFISDWYGLLDSSDAAACVEEGCHQSNDHAKPSVRAWQAWVPDLPGNKTQSNFPMGT